MVEQDYDFAKHLDLNCENCMAGRRTRIGEPMNGAQLRLIEQRKGFHPKEGDVLDYIKLQCNDCLSKGRRPENSIYAKSSCFWREGLT